MLNPKMQRKITIGLVLLVGAAMVVTMVGPAVLR